MPKFGFTILLRIFTLLWLTSSAILPAQAKLPQLESLFDSQSTSRFLPVSEAFSFNFSQQGSQVSLEWNIADGYYLYQDKISVTAQDAKIGTQNMPNGEPYEDEFFGKVSIYKNQLNIVLSLMSAKDNATLIINYQGCAEAGFCYPPESLTIPISAVVAKEGNNNPTSANKGSPVSSPQTTKVTSLTENWWQPLLFFLLGIGLAFTPCLLPMYPILTGIVLGGGKKNFGKIFSLSFFYIQGMALTYTILGLIVASAGLQFQAALQHPYVLIALSIFFVIFAAAMFGVFTFQLPVSVQTQLAKLSNQQQGGSYKGVFAMGALSGLVCSPCTTAPLSGALLYVAQSGDLLTGAVTLYALALGMGVPLLLVALFGNKLLPKAGMWMEKIKTLFGFILLCAPLFFLERFLPENITMGLWLTWLLAISSWLYHSSRSISPSKTASLLAIVAILGISISAFHGHQLIFESKKNEVNERLHFIYIETVEDLERELATAKLASKPVMLDFYADWCVACKEYEKYTFTNDSVIKVLDKFILLQADVTKNNKQNIRLLKRMQVLGLPTIDFWNNQGEFISEARLNGFVKAEDFLAHLKNNF